jgi:hypothetical protein
MAELDTLSFRKKDGARASPFQQFSVHQTVSYSLVLLSLKLYNLEECEVLKTELLFFLFQDLEK